jgi:toxin ParE1/3/4
MDYEVILSPKALDDLGDIIIYISQDNPSAAKLFGKKLVEEIRVLEKLPKVGSVVPEIQDENIRQLVKKPYRIIYRIEEENKRVSVSRFWHSSRDNLKL